MPKVYHIWAIIAIAAIIVGAIIATAVVIRKRQRRANLSPARNLSKAELEKEKLRTEIRGLNKSQFERPSFWMSFFTFLIAVITYLWLLGSGVFDAKQAHLTYVTDTLEVYKNRLDTSIHKLKDSASKLNDSIHNLILLINTITTEETARINLITAEEVLAKKKYAVYQKEKLTKKELIEKA